MVRSCSKNGRRKITQNSIEVDAETKENTRKTEEKLIGRYKEGHERKKPKWRPGRRWEGMESRCRTTYNDVLNPIYCIHIKYFKFETESKVPFCPTYPAAQKAKLYFIAFVTSYLIWSDFSWVNYLVWRVCSILDIAQKGELRLSLTTMQPVIHNLASVHQAQGKDWIWGQL